MESERFDVNHTLVQLTMVLKLQQLKRNELPSLSYGNLEDYLMDSLWRNGLPASLHEAADEILSVKASDIVRFLSQKAVLDGSRQNLEDFRDVIGGDM
ncbi:MAG: hypothetical protein IKR11_01300 [Solobacterium sp.]|nr:hypothetical protein [Solobacterium sp.]